MPVADLIEGVQAILANQSKYDKAEEYYEGEVDEVFASANMRRRLNALSGKYKVNLANTPVDALSERLKINAVTVPGNDAANAALQEYIWTTETQLDAKDWLTQSGEYGDGLLFVWESQQSIVDIDPDSEQDHADRGAAEQLDDGNDDVETEPLPDMVGVDLIWNSPKTTRVMYDPENNAFPVYAIKFWKQNNRFRVTLYYADTIERWFAKGDSDPKTAASWNKFYDDETDDSGAPAWPLPNPHGRIPLFHFRNGKPYGRPEHKNAYGPQNALNKLVPAHMATVDFQSFPQRYVLTETDAPGEDEDDDVEWWPDDTKAQTIRQQDRSKLKSGAAEVWWFDHVKEVGQFATADSDSFMKPMPMYVQLMAQTTQTPVHYFDPGGDKPSGESYRAADMPMVKKAEDRQKRYGLTLSAALSFALEIMGFGKCVVEVHWASAGVADDQNSWETTLLKINAGIPPRQALLEAGYTEAQLDNFGITDDQSDVNLKRKIAILAQIAATGQGFGVAAQFEIFDIPVIKALLEEVVTQDGSAANEQ